MQTFSNMQRSRTSQNPLKQSLWALLLVGYGFISPLYFFLPPLLGIFYLRYYLYNEKHFLIFLIIYLLVFEANRLLPLFSTLFFGFLYYMYIMPFIEKKIICQGCIGIIGITTAYVGYFVAVESSIMILGLPSFFIEWPIIVLYIISEIVIDFLTRQSEY